MHPLRIPKIMNFGVSVIGTAGRCVSSNARVSSKTFNIRIISKVQTEQKNARQMFATKKHVDVISTANKTAPIGAPKQAVTPAPTAAAITFCRWVVFLRNRLNTAIVVHNRAEKQHDICINGESFPTGNPAARAQVNPNNLHIIVLKERRVTGASCPKKIDFSSGMPDPAASGAR